MTTQRPITIRKIDHVAERVYSHENYVVTFGPDGTSTDLWTLSNDNRALEHLKTLGHPGVIAPIVDGERNLVAISTCSSSAPEIHISDIESGNLIRTLTLYGSLYDEHMPYSSRLGLALVSTRVVDELPRVLVVDVAGNGWIEGVAHIPPDLRTSTDRLSPLFGAEHITDDGDIICSYVEPLLPDIVDHFSLMRWEGIPHGNTLPTARAEFPVTLEDGDAVSTSCCIPFRGAAAAALLIAACETVAETVYSCWSVVRAIDIRTLSALWTAEPIWGIIRHLYHVVDAGVVIATGMYHTPDNTRKNIPLSIIAALDDQTGALLRLEQVNRAVQGVSVRLCAAARDAVVIVFVNGEVSITLMDDFLSKGLARNADSQKVVTTRLSQGDGTKVVDVAIASSSVVVATQAKLVVVSW
ncbi:hypothetical protein EXIGLDRAFT_777029 [Exidia glandulosa HHB12029]|uniref:Cleavage/polyadenylation specificity factor A subunit N-terminal domain-containing protein n=1 Tax=Exidia glandulosa HHB12029 TaxID=1314781 RepID=A0A165D8B4_EXIGL|nr:hypothetical protein EXIGLDRAFT_777029 [Exidia glandulosa HHB12029]